MSLRLAVGSYYTKPSMSTLRDPPLVGLPACLLLCPFIFPSVCRGHLNILIHFNSLPHSLSLFILSATLFILLLCVFLISARLAVPTSSFAAQWRLICWHLTGHTLPLLHPPSATWHQTNCITPLLCCVDSAIYLRVFPHFLASSLSLSLLHWKSYFVFAFGCGIAKWQRLHFYDIIAV